METNTLGLVKVIPKFNGKGDLCIPSGKLGEFRQMMLLSDDPQVRAKWKSHSISYREALLLAAKAHFEEQKNHFEKQKLEIRKSIAKENEAKNSELQVQSQLNAISSEIDRFAHTARQKKVLLDAAFSEKEHQKPVEHTKSRIEKELNQLPGWSLIDHFIIRRMKFDDLEGLERFFTKRNIPLGRERVFNLTASGKSQSRRLAACYEVLLIKALVVGKVATPGMQLKIGLERQGIPTGWLLPGNGDSRQSGVLPDEKEVMETGSKALEEGIQLLLAVAGALENAAKKIRNDYENDSIFCRIEKSTPKIFAKKLQYKMASAIIKRAPHTGRITVASYLERQLKLVEVMDDVVADYKAAAKRLENAVSTAAEYVAAKAQLAEKIAEKDGLAKEIGQQNRHGSLQHEDRKIVKNIEEADNAIAAIDALLKSQLK